MWRQCCWTEGHTELQGSTPPTLNISSGLKVVPLSYHKGAEWANISTIYNNVLNEFMSDNGVSAAVLLIITYFMEQAQ